MFPYLWNVSSPYKTRNDSRGWLFKIYEQQFEVFLKKKMNVNDFKYFQNISLLKSDIIHFSYILYKYTSIYII